VLGPVRRPAGLGWLRLREATPAPGDVLADEARPALAFVAAAEPAVSRRVRALGPDGGGRLVGRLTAGPDLRLGPPVRMEAKARALGLVLDDLSAEEERSAAYLDLSVPERPALAAGPAGGLD
jgi:hypothetical protein